jgi:crotonobetainyl-CoA:carnitine CoA-transferase CaiB-like acyl-CoA transferase
MKTVQALKGLRVVDFTQLLQVPYATQRLNDIGADNIKIGKAGQGDPYRQMIFFNQWIGENESPCFLPWNLNKRSLGNNLKDPEARGILLKLEEKADEVVQNFRPGVMDKLGLGYEDLVARKNDRIGKPDGNLRHLRENQGTRCLF